MLSFCRLTVLCALVSAALSTAIAYADDATAEQLYKDGLAAFDQRDVGQRAKDATDILAKAMAQNPNPELAYRISILSSRAFYWMGKHVKTDAEKMNVFDQAMQQADAARKINDDYADGYYYYALSLGKWCLAKGVVASLFRKKELITAAEGALDRTTQDGEEGATLDFYGPNRVLGHMYFKLPGFAGGSHEKAIQYLSEAYTKAPTHVLNVIYFAEALNDGNGGEKAKAKQILDDLLAKDPKTLNPARLPETIEEFEEARELRHDLGN